MRKCWLLVFFGLLFVAGLARAEEITLKDGTKIVGRMVAIKGDTIEIQTLYGKIKLNRSDIVAISFSESQPKPTPAIEEKKEEKNKDWPKVEQSQEGTAYTNPTGNFRVTLPQGWKFSEEQRAQNDFLAFFQTSDETLFAVVSREDFNGSLQAYKGVTEVYMKNNMADYEKVSEANTTIDGKDAVFLIVKSNLTEGSQKFPLKYLIGIIKKDGQMTKISCWSLEPLFSDAQSAFEQLIQSYRTMK